MSDETQNTSVPDEQADDPVWPPPTVEGEWQPLPGFDIPPSPTGVKPWTA